MSHFAPNPPTISIGILHRQFFDKMGKQQKGNLSLSALIDSDDSDVAPAPAPMTKASVKGTATKKAGGKVQKATRKQAADSDEDELEYLHASAPRPKTKLLKPTNKLNTVAEDDSEPEAQKAKMKKGKSASASAADATDYSIAPMPTKIVAKKKAQEIPETQVVNGDDSMMDIDEDEEEEEPTPAKLKVRGGAKSTDSAALQRQLNEMTRRFAAMETKYNKVKEQRSSDARDAESNFAAYKKSADARFKEADNLIAMLQEEVAETSKVAEEAKKARKASKKEQEEIEALQERVEELEEELEKSQNQIGLLNAKILARSSSSAGHYELKEDIYADLSGVLIRSIAPSPDGSGSVFDIIQTGRNGTLHYKLALDHIANPSNAQFTYTPLLDAERDKKLVEVLPEYLTDTIMFAREQASMFFWRLTNFMQKNVD
ncbi:hypothetical protein SAICODRAFT_8853 [Saitoella complicata NRRL Y-17804]|nr:uncharacterized protein SAICODRAFT_8853 [Saitoella complicata NRRL Y-17804]ODQ51557.1 hypothetical protein SAICODRAFT_8853 [Saitoella complicata NRRL Y-17804]